MDKQYLKHHNKEVQMDAMERLSQLSCKFVCIQRVDVFAFMKSKETSTYKEYESLCESVKTHDAADIFSDVIKEVEESERMRSFLAEKSRIWGNNPLDVED